MISDRQKAQDGYLFGLGIMKASAIVAVEDARFDHDNAKDNYDITNSKTELEKALVLLGMIEDRIKSLSE